MRRDDENNQDKEVQLLFTSLHTAFALLRPLNRNEARSENKTLRFHSPFTTFSVMLVHHKIRYLYGEPYYIHQGSFGFSIAGFNFHSTVIQFSLLNVRMFLDNKYYWYFFVFDVMTKILPYA